MRSRVPSNGSWWRKGFPHDPRISAYFLFRSIDGLGSYVPEDKQRALREGRAECPHEARRKSAHTRRAGETVIQASLWCYTTGLTSRY